MRGYLKPILLSFALPGIGIYNYEPFHVAILGLKTSLWKPKDRNNINKQVQDDVGY
jgi:hypothetical protein